MRMSSCAVFLAAAIALSPAIHANAQIQVKPVYRAPRLCSLNINNGSETTTSRSITLNCDTSTVAGATEYHASERQDFADASWQPLKSAMPFYLSTGDGLKTVYFQLRNAGGVNTGITSKSITLQTRRDFSVNSLEAQDFANTQGFRFAAAAGDTTSNCMLTGERGVNIDAIASGKTIFTGARCDFILFGGRDLKTGWNVKSYESDGSFCMPPGKGYTVVERPVLGYGKITFRIQSWADAPNTCQFIVKKITLTGPISSTDWRDAFR